MSTPAAQPIKEPVSSPAPAAKNASRTSQQGVALERRRIVIVCAVLITLLGSGILLAMTTDLTSTIIRHTPLAARDPFGTEERNASIVLPAANNRCRQIAFNNDTGRMVETARPCETKPAFDDKGVPIPEATMRRLDSIRQGFNK